MQLKSKIMLGAVGWLALISGLHAALNVNWAAILNDYRPAQERKITVAYLPVTCQLTCPVTDYISKYSLSGEEFLPRMFQGFPEIKEALISNRVQAAFIVELAAKLHGGVAPKQLAYRGVQPLFEGSEFSVNADEIPAGMELWTANSQGQPTMKGTATW